MPMNRLSVLLAIALVGAAVDVATAQTVRWSGELRLRTEIDNRHFSAADPPNHYTLSRARLGATVELDRHVALFAQLQDSRQFGEAGNTLAALGNVDLHQAFLDVREPFGLPAGLRAGRMELSYGNERLVGAVGWHNVGRAFDGAVIDVDAGFATIDLFATTIRETHPYAPVGTPAATMPGPPGKHYFSGLYARMRPDSRWAIDAFLLWDNQPRARDADVHPLSRWTAGTYLRGTIVETLTAHVEGAYQFGRTAGLNIGAYLLAAKLEQRVGRHAIAAGYDLLSGTPAGAGRVGAFDPLYHTGHRFYGFMDYFIAVPAQTAGRGLHDLWARARLVGASGVTLEAWLHNFWFDQPAADGGRFLGHEVDLVARIPIHNVVTAEAGFSVFAGTPRMTAPFLGDDLGWWSYVSLRAGF